MEIAKNSKEQNLYKFGMRGYYKGSYKTGIMIIVAKTQVEAIEISQSPKQKVEGGRWEFDKKLKGKYIGKSGVLISEDHT